MGKIVDMTGWKMWEHGVPDSKLIVIKQVESYVSPNGYHKAQWLCECTCNERTHFTAIGQDIRCGKTKSCGCIHAQQAVINGQNNRKHNKFILNLEDEYGLYGIGYCSNTNSEFLFDMDDYDKIKDYCWYEHIHAKTGYHACEAQEHKSHKSILMHWVVIGKYYDHIDRNPLNNRKHNLRQATRVENARNRSKQRNNKSGIIGVYWRNQTHKWEAKITANYQKIFLGRFVNKDDAIRARLKAEIEHFGEFAPQQHLFEQYNIIHDSKEIEYELQQSS